MSFGIKDAIDIIVVATLMFYTYRMMKESGTIMDMFVNIGLIIIVILFQDQIKRILVEIGSHKRWQWINGIFKHNSDDETKEKKWILPVVYACMNMAKSKTGALIVIQQKMLLDDYEHTGDIINANINARLIENIFFKNSPLHDGAMIIAGERIASAGCILPVSHDTNLPRNLGLRHRSALGIAQATDAVAVVVSEETGNISMAYRGKLFQKLTNTALENRLSEICQ